MTLARLAAALVAVGTPLLASAALFLELRGISIRCRVSAPRIVLRGLPDCTDHE